MRASEFITEEPIKLSGFGPSEKTKEWVAKVYEKFPESPLSRNNRLMTFGEGDDMQIVQFELTPKQGNKVELKWIQATPLRTGAGSKAIRILQDLAQQDGIALTLFPWDKGAVSQAKLIKFYKKHGFQHIGKSKNMKWEPTNESQQLDETLSRIVYHYTNIHAAAKILSSGEFQLSSSMGSIEQQYAPKGYHYFLSTTRTPRGGYHEYVGQAAVLFVLNGNYYNNNYPSKPVDYWVNRDPAKSGNRRHEAEDRLFSKDASLPIGGVTAVHILVKEDADPNSKALARMSLLDAKKRGIAAYYYNDESAWRNLDTSKTSPVTNLTGKKEFGRTYRRHRGWLIPWLEVMQATDRSQLSSKAKDIIRNLDSNYYQKETAQGLATDLSNARKPSSGPDRKNAIKIINYMKQNKLNTLIEFVDAMAKKWEALNKS